MQVWNAAITLLLLGKLEGKCSRVSYSLTLNKRSLISNAVYSLLESLWQSQYLGDYQEAHFQSSYQTYPEGSMLFKALQYFMATASHFENSTCQCLIWIWSMEGPKSFVSQFLEFHLCQKWTFKITELELESIKGTGVKKLNANKSMSLKKQ